MPEIPPFAVLKLKTGAEFSSDLDNENRLTLRSFLGGTTGNLIDTVTIGRTSIAARRIMQTSTQKSGKRKAFIEEPLVKVSVREIPSEIPGVKIFGYWSDKNEIKRLKLKKSARSKSEYQMVEVSVTKGNQAFDNTGLEQGRVVRLDTGMVGFLKNYLNSPNGNVESAFDDDPELEAVELCNLDYSDHGNRLASILTDQSGEVSVDLTSADSGELEAWLTQDAPAPSNLAELRLQTRSRLRDEILQKVKLFSPKEVAKACGNSTENARTFGQRLRKAGALAVREANAFKFPAFQFQESGRLNPMMKEVLATINSGRSEDEISDGWHALIWFYAPSGLLLGERPMDMLEREPGRVLKAAKLRFPKN